MVKPVRIIPPDAEENGLIVGKKGWGTRVVTGDGAEIRGVKSAVIRIYPDEIMSAELEVFASFASLDVEPAYYMYDPLTQERRRIAKIVWADGTLSDLT